MAVLSTPDPWTHSIFIDGLTTPSRQQWPGQQAPLTTTKTGGSRFLSCFTCSRYNFPGCKIKYLGPAKNGRPGYARLCHVRLWNLVWDMTCLSLFYIFFTLGACLGRDGETYKHTIFLCLPLWNPVLVGVLSVPYLFDFDPMKCSSGFQVRIWS